MRRPPLPVHEIGYRHFEGPTRGPLPRALAISRRGVTLAFRSAILRKFFYFVYAPLLYYVPVFLAVGFLTQPSGDVPGMWGGIGREFFGRSTVEAFRADPVGSRQAAWSTVFYAFFANVGIFLVFFVTAFIGPTVISRDVRSRSFLLYFSKPITPGEYILGKAGIVGTFVALVTLVPALLLYVISIAFSPSIGAFFETWTTLWRIVVVEVVLVVPVASVMLLFSSLVRDARFAAFGWIVVCLFGEVAYQALRRTPELRDSGWLFLLSPRQMFLAVCQYVFEAREQLERLGQSRALRWLASDLKTDGDALVALTALAGISVVSLAAVRGRIHKVLRA